MMRPYLLVLSLAFVATIANRAVADSAQAKPHIDNAKQLYEEGKAAEALDELNIAYQLDPSPELLYAIAQTHVVLGKCDEAIKFYEQFLATDPKEGPARKAREAIDHCKTAAPQPEPTPPPPPPPAPAPVDEAGPRAWYKNPVGLALVGGGVVVGVIGGVLYTSARNDFDSAKTASDYPTHHDLIERGRSRRTLSVVAGVGGVALVGAGVAYIVISHRSQAANVAVAPANGGGIVTWSGTF